ncbi:MAG: glycosyltransferase family 39 protein [Desulfovibrio sp.]|jgi:hypothetical protein|nr:glycosyltransferase family 39 protein [Desulfovibrio sp.]
MTQEKVESDAAEHAAVFKENGAGEFKTSEKRATPSGGNIFQTLGKAGPLLLLALLAAHVWHGFVGTVLYCPPEADSILLYKLTAQSGQWLVTAPGDMVQWPVFTWFLTLLAPLLTHLDLARNLLFPAAAALGALLALFAVYGLSRAAGFGAQAALAAGLILLCSPVFALMPHFTGPETLGAALLLLSLACICRGLQKERDWLSLPAGFLLAALAGLCSGLFHALLPLLAGFLFLVWTGKMRRQRAPDAIAGFTLFLLCLTVWLGCLIYTNSTGYVRYLQQNLFLFPWPPRDSWWLPLAFAGAGLVPWVALVFCVSWNRVLLSALSDLKASRAERSGAAFVWISLLAGCVLSLISPETESVALCLLCLAAILLGKALLRLSALGSRLFYGITALCLLFAGLALTASGFAFSLDALTRALSFTLAPEQRELLLSLKTAPIVGTICLVAALVLARFVKRGMPGGALLACALISVALTQSVTLLLAPALEAVPQAQLRRADDINPKQASPAPMVRPAETPDSARIPEQPPAPEQDAGQGMQEATPPEAVPKEDSPATSPPENQRQEQPSP